MGTTPQSGLLEQYDAREAVKAYSFGLDAFIHFHAFLTVRTRFVLIEINRRPFGGQRRSSAR